MRKPRVQKNKYVVTFIYPQRKFTISEYNKKEDMYYFPELTDEEIAEIENFTIPTENYHSEILWSFVERYELEEFRKGII